MKLKVPSNQFHRHDPHYHHFYTFIFIYHLKEDYSPGQLVTLQGHQQTVENFTQTFSDLCDAKTQLDVTEARSVVDYGVRGSFSSFSQVTCTVEHPLWQAGCEVPEWLLYLSLSSIRSNYIITLRDSVLTQSRK
jgi:hypothetical protein